MFNDFSQYNLLQFFAAFVILIINNRFHNRKAFYLVIENQMIKSLKYRLFCNNCERDHKGSQRVKK